MSDVRGAARVSFCVKPMRIALRIVLGIIALAMLLNGAAWVVFSATQGGSALLGKVEAGRYYLGDHGRYTEVSARKYQLSRWLTISNMIIIPAGVLGGLLYEYRKGNFRARRA